MDMYAGKNISGVCPNVYSPVRAPRRLLCARRAKNFGLITQNFESSCNTPPVGVLVCGRDRLPFQWNCPPKIMMKGEFLQVYTDSS